MKNTKYILAMCLGITLLSGAALHAEQRTTLETPVVTEMLNSGELRDGVLHVSPMQAAGLLEDNPKIRVLDVRTEWEYNRGHLPDAVQINYYSLGFEKQLTALDKSVTWLVHCKTGVRSGNTLQLMRAAGFKSVVHMDGGIDGWRDANLPVVVEN